MLTGVFWEEREISKGLWEHKILAEHFPSFEAGQYLSLETSNGAKIGIFSIASPTQKLPFLSFYSRHPWKLTAQQTLFLQSPMGNMIAAPQRAPYQFFAAGTGITPFLSLLASGRLKESDYDCLWLIKDPAEENLLQKTDLSHLHQKIQIVFYEHQNNEALFEIFDTFYRQDCTYYIAGPYAFIKNTGLYLKEVKQCASNRIYSDMINFGLT